MKKGQEGRRGVKKRRGVGERAGASGNLTGTEDGVGSGEVEKGERDGGRWREALL